MNLKELVTKRLGSEDSLDLEKERLGDKGAKELSQFKILTKVRNLILGDNEIGDDGVRALANSPYLAYLRVLNLKSNNITALGAKALAESKAYPKLDQLIIKFNNIIQLCCGRTMLRFPIAEKKKSWISVW